LIEPGLLKADSAPLVTVSVISHGDWLPLQPLLASLRKHENPDRLQIILTDNLGKDLPEIDADGWHSLRLIRNTAPQGYAQNHNEAFKLAQGTYFCALNPDVEFLQPTIETLVSILEAGSVDIIAPLVVDPEGRVQDSFRRLPTPWELVGRWTGRSPKTVEAPATDLAYVDWIAGIFMLMHRRILSGLGGFDQAYRLYFEDVDLCTRARLMGLRIAVAPRLRLQHDARRASRRPGRHLIWHVRSAIRFFASDAYRQARLLPGHHA
jgi:N-acetylglucosaminyl-diphospho-decaprenol L-rhamnosyltransferase